MKPLGRKRLGTRTGYIILVPVMYGATLVAFGVWPGLMVVGTGILMALMAAITAITAAIGADTYRPSGFGHDEPPVPLKREEA